MGITLYHDQIWFRLTPFFPLILWFKLIKKESVTAPPREGERESMTTVFATREYPRAGLCNIPSSVWLKTILTTGRVHEKIRCACDKHILIFNAESDNLMKKMRPSEIRFLSHNYNNNFCVSFRCPRICFDGCFFSFFLLCACVFFFCFFLGCLFVRHQKCICVLCPRI